MPLLDPPWTGMSTTPTNSSFVAGLPTISPSQLAENEYDRQCPLCKSVCSADGASEGPVVLPCQHVFDREGLNEWLSEEKAAKNTCPYCRSVLFEAQGQENTEADPSDWPRDDDASAAWLSDFIHLNLVRTDLEMYLQLYRKGFFAVAPNPRAGELTHQEELALFKVLVQRSTFCLPTWCDTTDEELLEALRAISWGWTDDPAAWLLYGAFPRYDPAWYFYDF